LCNQAKQRQSGLQLINNKRETNHNTFIKKLEEEEEKKEL